MITSMIALTGGFLTGYFLTKALEAWRYRSFEHSIGFIFFSVMTTLFTFVAVVGLS